MEQAKESSRSNQVLVENIINALANAYTVGDDPKRSHAKMWEKAQNFKNTFRLIVEQHPELRAELQSAYETFGRQARPVKTQAEFDSHPANEPYQESLQRILDKFHDIEHAQHRLPSDYYRKLPEKERKFIDTIVDFLDFGRVLNCMHKAAEMRRKDGKAEIPISLTGVSHESYESRMAQERRYFAHHQEGLASLIVRSPEFKEKLMPFALFALSDKSTDYDATVPPHARAHDEAERKFKHAELEILLEEELRRDGLFNVYQVLHDTKKSFTLKPAQPDDPMRRVNTSPGGEGGRGRGGERAIANPGANWAE